MHKSMLFQRMIILINTLCMLFFCSTINAAMYKWVDEDGNTHYTQSPPADGIDSESITPPPKVDNESAVKSLEYQKKKVESLRENRLNTLKEKEKQEQEIADTDRRCKNARLRVSTYKRPRVNVVDEDGNRIRATEEQRLAELKKAQDFVSENCK